MIGYLTLSLKREEVLVHQKRSGKCDKKNYCDCVVGMDNCFGYGKSVHKVRDCPNLKGQDKGSGQSKASRSNMDPLKKNHFYALFLGVNKRVLPMS